MTAGVAANPPLAQQLFIALADGRFHSGSKLALTFGVTRSAVWKAIEHLRDLGAVVQAVTGRGYRLAAAVSPLDVSKIVNLLGDESGRIVIDVQWSLESTNASLLALEVPPAGAYRALLAENQTAGRGRRGRSWHAPLGGAICLSIAVGFADLPPDASALSLAMGVCVLRSLRRLGEHALTLKWPNDIVAPGGKLGGILIELRAESAGPAHVVVGIGLNVRLDAATKAAVRETGSAAVDLQSLGFNPLRRNECVASLIAECMQGLREFAGSGFSTFVSEWQAADALRDQPVSVAGAGESLTGVARGIDRRGALQVKTATGMRSVVAGEVSVRAQT